jgi:hypothetical protein
MLLNLLLLSGVLLGPDHPQCVRLEQYIVAREPGMPADMGLDEVCATSQRERTLELCDAYEATCAHLQGGH